MSVNFRSIAMEVNVPRDESVSIAIELAFVTLRREVKGKKKNKKKKRLIPLSYLTLLRQTFFNPFTSADIYLGGVSLCRYV